MNEASDAEMDITMTYSRHLQVGLVGMPDPERWGRGQRPELAADCTFLTRA
jgi:hypothetical protein